MKASDISRKELGDCLKVLREDRKIILVDLAKKTGLSAAHLSRIENARADVSVRGLQSILATLHLRPLEQQRVMRAVFRAKLPVDQIFETVYDKRKDVRFLLRVIAGLPEAVSEDDLIFLLQQQGDYRQVMNSDLIMGMIKQRRL